MTDTSLTMRLALDAARWRRSWGDAQRTATGAARGMRRELGEVGSLMRSIRSHAAAVGVSFGAMHTLMNSAKLDKSLIAVKQTAGATTEQTEELRKQLFEMSTETGQAMESLQGSFMSLIQSGQDWKSSMAALPAINKAMAVSGASGETLAAALSVASEAFDFDLSKAGAVEALLDKMVVAGRLGNAELENLSSIFGRVGVNAKAANLTFDETLGLVEQLSLIERQPERLATLVDSTLRIFNNEKYKKQISKAVGVSFFNDDGSSRNALDMLDQISQKYKVLQTDKERALFIGKAFGKTDLDTQRGLRSLLGGESMANLESMVGGVAEAVGTIENDLPGAIKNAVDQAGRLKNVLGEAADRFARPINKTFADAASKLINPKEEGGFDLSGEKMILGAGGIAALLYGAKKFGPKLLGKFGSAAGGVAGGVLNTAGGVAIGKSLEASAGITPVYVVNMPAGGLGAGAVDQIINGVSGPALRGGAGNILRTIGFAQLRNQSISNIAAMGGTAALKSAGFVGAAGAAGYAAGTALYRGALDETAFADRLGSAIAKTLAFFGNDEAKASVEREQKYKLQLEIESKGGHVNVKHMGRNPLKQMEIDVLTGPAFGMVPP